MTIVATKLTENNAFGVDFAFMTGGSFADFLPVPMMGASQMFPLPAPGPNGGAGLSNPGSVIPPTPAPNLKIGISYNNINILIQALDRVSDTAILSNPKVLTEAGVSLADALILTIPDEEAAVRACAVARKLAPRIFIAARTNHVSQGMVASQAGADEVIVEEVVTADAMQRAVMRKLFD